LRDDVTFVAKFIDGSEECFDVSWWDLRRGDHVALLIAFERQHARYLKPGKIIKIWRETLIH
jgi:hypothetical protein